MCVYSDNAQMMSKRGKNNLHVSLYTSSNQWLGSAGGDVGWETRLMLRTAVFNSNGIVGV